MLDDEAAALSIGLVEEPLEDRERVIIARCRTGGFLSLSLSLPLPLPLPTGGVPEEGQKGLEKAVVVFVSVSVVALSPAIVLAFTFPPSTVSVPATIPPAFAVAVATGGPVVGGL